MISLSPTATREEVDEQVDAHLGEHITLPAHPIVVGWIIMQLYPDLESALATTKHGWHTAVGDGRIPNTGWSVNTALDVLKFWKEFTPEGLAEYADKEWRRGGAGGYEERVEPGSAQGKKFAGLYIEKAKTWFKR